jgi:hypothetical protein
MGNPITAALASSHEAINNANKFSGSVTHQAGNKSDPTAPSKPPEPKSDYSMARAARRDGHTFMGVGTENQGPELRAAQDNREAVKPL